jgi:hypothetical protein
MTLLTTPLTTFENRRSTPGLNRSQDPSVPFDLVSIQNFGTFSKVSLNTSKLPIGKNVQNFKAHNFSVEWHC